MRKHRREGQLTRYLWGNADSGCSFASFWRAFLAFALHADQRIALSTQGSKAADISNMLAAELGAHLDPCSKFLIALSQSATTPVWAANCSVPTDWML